MYFHFGITEYSKDPVNNFNDQISLIRRVTTVNNGSNVIEIISISND